MIINAIIFAIIFIEFGTSQHINKNVTDLQILSKFISRLDNMHRVHMHTCWTKRSITTFRKLLTTHSNKYQKIMQQTFNDFQDNKLVRILDLHCENAMELLINANQTNMFKWPSSWIVLTDSITTFPADLNIFQDSRVYILQSNDRVVFTLFRYQHEQEYIFHVVCVIEGNELEAFKSVREFSDRRNTRKRALNIGYVAVFHTSHKELLEFRNLEKDTYSKFHSHLMEALIQMLNATMTQHFVTFWGGVNKTTKKSTGLIGLFDQDIIDIGSTCVLISVERNPIISYANKYVGEGMLVFRDPPLSVVRNILRMPLQDKVWGSIFLLLIIQFLIVLAITKWEWRKNAELSPQEKNNVLRPRLLDVAQLQVGALFQQGSEAEPKSAAGQVVTFFLFLSFLFFYTAYSACIVALLQSTANSLHSLDDMTNSDIRVQLDNISYMPFFVQMALTSQAARDFYATKIAPHGAAHDVHYVDVQEGVLNCVRDQFCALIVDVDRAFKLIMKTFTEAEKCGVKTMRFAPEYHPYIPYRNGTAYKEFFRVGLALTNEVGIRKRTYLRVLAPVPKCINSGGIFRSVSLMDCYFALLCFSIGISFALLVFALELTYSKFEQHKAKRGLDIRDGIRSKLTG